MHALDARVSVGTVARAPTAPDGVLDPTASIIEPFCADGASVAISCATISTAWPSRPCLLQGPRGATVASAGVLGLRPVSVRPCAHLARSVRTYCTNASLHRMAAPAPSDVGQHCSSVRYWGAPADARARGDLGAHYKTKRRVRAHGDGHT